MKLWQPEIFKYYKVAGFFSEKINNMHLYKLDLPIFFPKQIHSDHIILLDEHSSLAPREGDGVITTRKDIFLGIQTADCVPILLADKKKRVVGAIHAGWKGTVKGILSKALQNIISMGIKPEEILLALGPHIQSSCYEVKEDVLALLKAPYDKSPFVLSKGGSYYLNLATINLFQAKEWNIPEENIWVSEECTHCIREKYHSYRRERNYAFTQIALISPCEEGMT